MIDKKTELNQLLHLEDIPVGGLIAGPITNCIYLKLSNGDGMSCVIDLYYMNKFLWDNRCVVKEFDGKLM